MPNLTDRLEGFLGRNIDEICPNNFHDATANHCAHFVGHAMGLTNPFTCVGFQGGDGEPANIRVHETFKACSRVGHWAEADRSATQLVFVTRRDVVDVATKTMANIPQKHIGVYHDGFVYHYSNGGDRVVKQTPDDFLARFEAIYDGTQGLYFGIPDGTNLQLRVDPTGTSLAGRGSKVFELIGPDNRHWNARLRGEEQSFYVGREIRDVGAGFFGLFMPGPRTYGPQYRGDDYVREIDHWAYLLEATGFCESGNRFNLFNTYDRARFTFGFYQLAAHTPRDNLILLLRALAAGPEMADYFPELKMIGGRLHRVDPVNGATDLEAEFQVGDETQLFNLMTYLNPRRQEVDPQEILHAARFVHWANTSPAMRRTQVMVANDILQHKMATRYRHWFELDGRSDVICLAVADILHQGRGRKAVIRAALAAADPLPVLLDIGRPRHAARCDALADVIGRLTAAGKIGGKVYVAALNEFRDR